MHCIRGEFHKKKKKDLSSEESTCDAASHLCATAARRKRRNGTIASHQQVKEFQRQFLSRARSFAPSVVFSFPPSSLLVLATIRNGNGAQLHAFFSPLSRCSFSSINSCSSRRLQDHPPPPFSPPSIGCGERRENHMQREEWSYLHPEIPLPLHCGGN